jgi:hypothetical protein
LITQCGDPAEALSSVIAIIKGRASMIGGFVVHF